LLLMYENILFVVEINVAFLVLLQVYIMTR
jgi:hypothetical protein